MTVPSDSLLAQVDPLIPATAVDRRLAPAVVVTLVIGGYMALGFAFGLSAEGYLLLGIPITIAFQLLVVRRPLRALWLRDASPLTLTPRSAIAVGLVSIAPATIVVRGLQDGNGILTAYGLAAIVGSVGAVHALRAVDREAVRSTVQATLINSAILVGVMVVYRLMTGGFNGSVAAAVVTLVISLATYLPVVFVMEEVLFRGLLDPYLHGSSTGPDRASALYGSALWGVWHLPVAFVSLGILTIPYLVAVHSALGYFLVRSWRRTGNLAAPGIAHAVADALRNAVAVL
jgi:membrane protease YdiL (CAAX protease family)